MQPVPGTLACNAKTQEIQTFSNHTIPDEWICSYSIFLHEYGQCPRFGNRTENRSSYGRLCTFVGLDPSFEIPVVFIQGRKDPLIPGELIERYFSSLVAPRGKKLVWLEDAGHMPHFEEPDGFQRAVSSAADRLAGDYSNEQ